MTILSLPQLNKERELDFAWKDFISEVNLFFNSLKQSNVGG